MAKKIMVDIFRKKSLDELSQALAQPESRLESGSAAAAVAAVAASLFCRAAQLAAGEAEQGGRMEYILRNCEILRKYMLHLVDEDVKCRGPLNRALREGEPRAIEAARQPAAAISGEILNMMGKLLELGLELKPLCPKAAVHYLAEGAELAISAGRSARLYIMDMSGYCSDETYRYVSRRENELLLEQFEPMARELVSAVEG